MLRLIVLVFLVYGMASGLREGWLVVKWSQFFYSIGFTKVEPDKPMNWSKFIINTFANDSSKQSEDEL